MVSDEDDLRLHPTRENAYQRSIRSQAALITETLSVPSSTLDVPIAFLNGMIAFRREQLTKSKQMAIEAPDDWQVRLDALTKIEFWSELLPWYEDCVQFYECERTVARASNRPVLKPSKWKKEKLWGFVASNLCVQQNAPKRHT